jgi:uncharacterized protein (TIGR02145 family)
MSIRSQVIIVLLISQLFAFRGIAQVLITSDGSIVADSTSILELKSTTRGLLPPRMTQAERNAIVNPTPGLLIYCSDCLELQLYNDTAWTNMIGLPPSVAPWTCGNPITYEGQDYATIEIGTQCWMAENLNVGTFVIGSSGQSDNGIIEKHCYSNNPTKCDLYGGFYRWNEAMQYSTAEEIQGICPDGWHIPSDVEFKTLELELGMTQIQVDLEGGNRGNNEGSKIAKNEGLWTNGNLDSNPEFESIGFGVLPTGYTNVNGISGYEFLDNAMWTSTIHDTNHAWFRLLQHNNPGIGRYNGNQPNGYSIRCIQN